MISFTTGATPPGSLGLAAVRAGDWAGARREFEALDAAGRATAETLALLGTACRRLGDARAAHAAADRALLLDARNLRACLLKADLLVEQGAAKEANVYYRGAVEVSDEGVPVPADLTEGVTRARAWRERLVAEMAAALEAGLSRAGYRPESSPPRFRHALELATGKKRVYVQQPRNFFYPELPNTQFYPRELFPWMDALEAATGAITEELSAVLASEEGFAPYLQTSPLVPNRPGYPLIDSMDWSTCYLWREGRETEIAARFPQTMAALAHAPLCRIRGRSPQVMFSQLKAGAHILPHTGAVNTRLICHLPLIVPPNCYFRVGNDVRRWEVGKAWAFDDTIEHEARNNSDRPRVVLIFDIWRPELSKEERDLVTTWLETVDAYAPSAGWE